MDFTQKRWYIQTIGKLRDYTMFPHMRYTRKSIGINFSGYLPERL